MKRLKHACQPRNYSWLNYLWWLNYLAIGGATLGVALLGFITPSYADLPSADKVVPPWLQWVPRQTQPPRPAKQFPGNPDDPDEPWLEEDHHDHSQSDLEPDPDTTAGPPVFPPGILDPTLHPSTTTPEPLSLADNSLDFDADGHDPRYGGGMLWPSLTIPSTKKVNAAYVRIGHYYLMGAQQGSSGLQFRLPSMDVRRVWMSNFSGSTVPLIMLGDFGVDPQLFPQHHSTLNNRPHQSITGYLDVMAAHEIAPGAAIFTLNRGVGNTPYRMGGVRTRYGDLVPNNVPPKVINWNFHADALLVPNPLALAFRSIFDTFIRDNPQAKDLLGGPTSNYPNFNQALITKPAGDDHHTPGDGAPSGGSPPSDCITCPPEGNGPPIPLGDAGTHIENIALVLNADLRPRVILVGALNKRPQDGGAELTYNSNFAGGYGEVQTRFLVEYGGTPLYEYANYLCNAHERFAQCKGSKAIPLVDTERPAINSEMAAARVAGYAALVRDKFTNLSAAQAASILLNTATYDGLKCATTTTGCSPAIYGRGRVNISAAISPAGRLR